MTVSFWLGCKWRRNQFSVGGGHWGFNHALYKQHKLDIDIVSYFVVGEYSHGGVGKGLQNWEVNIIGVYGVKIPKVIKILLWKKSRARKNKCQLKEYLPLESNISLATFQNVNYAFSNRHLLFFFNIFPSQKYSFSVLCYSPQVCAWSLVILMLHSKAIFYYICWWLKDRDQSNNHSFITEIVEIFHICDFWKLITFRRVNAFLHFVGFFLHRNPRKYLFFF